MENNSNIEVSDSKTETLILQELQMFVGLWQTVGKTADGRLLNATDVYEWLSGRYFLIHKWNACLDNDRVEGIEIIGYDQETGKYSTRAFDSLGNSGRYLAELNGDKWIIVGETERFTGEFNSQKNKIKGFWEMYSENEWIPWMEIVLNKIK